jgi:hypothetical protein
MSYTFLVFYTQPNFRSKSNTIQFTYCCLQSRLNQRRCQIFLFGGDVAGLSVVIRYGAFKSYAPTHNLITTVESPLWWFHDEITLSSKILNQIAFIAYFFSSNVESFSLKNLGDLPFDQVILRLFLVSHILAQSTKIWQHCIIAFLHCTIPYASSHKCIYNLEQECKYLMQSWMYPIQPCCHRMLSLASSGLLLLKLYLDPHPLDLPCVSYAQLPIM